MANERNACITLSLIPTIGPSRFFALLSAFGSISNALNASYLALKNIVGEKAAQAITEGPDDALLEKTLAWEDEHPDHFIITYVDDDYPAGLKEIEYPPPVLYAIGDTSLLRATALAIVGSRHPSQTGKDNAFQFAQSLSNAGLTIISGLAAGIDTQAHKGALEGIGSTIAVMGTGADLIYPASNHELAKKIADRGLLLTELPLSTPPKAENFPRRNRIISGLSFGCLVVEAALSSGSLITSRFALEQGKDVFAIPGSIHNPQSKGCHQLIKQGAKLVDSITDILEEIKLNLPESTLSVPDHQNIDNADSVDLSERLIFDPIDTENHQEKQIEKAPSTPIIELKVHKALHLYTAENLAEDMTAQLMQKLQKAHSLSTEKTETSYPATKKESKPKQTSTPPIHADVLTAMGNTTVDIDVLATILNIDIAKLQAKLLELEIHGLVEKLLSGQYRRIPKG